MTTQLASRQVLVSWPRNWQRNQCLCSGNDGSDDAGDGDTAGNIGDNTGYTSCNDTSANFGNNTGGDTCNVIIKDTGGNTCNVSDEHTVGDTGCKTCNVTGGDSIGGTGDEICGDTGDNTGDKNFEEISNKDITAALVPKHLRGYWRGHYRQH